MFPENIPEIMPCRHCNARRESPDWEYCPECKRDYTGPVYAQVSTREESGREQFIEMIRDAIHDIPEITSCRHCNAHWALPDWEYCPECKRNHAGAVYPQVSTREEILRTQQLIEMIRDAFRDVTLGDGFTIEEADLEGTWTEEKAKELRENAETADWQKVESRKIETMDAALSFFDPQGWLFHIPAFMIWSLDNWRTTDRITADSTIWGLSGYNFLISEGRIPKLNKAHIASIVAFLRFFVDHGPSHEASVALREFWTDKLKQLSSSVDK